MSEAAALHPDARLEASARKIRAPFHLDPSLCIYSPQSNRDALKHRRVASWLDFIANEWKPPEEAGERIALLIPCTKYKPYNTSREHRAINGALLAAGWEPAEDIPIPEGLEKALDDRESLSLLNTGTLRKNGVNLDRIVMSEPMAMVPYPYIYYWRGEESPATNYDDPGLFESRGTSVSPERSDSSAVPVGNGRWRWGPNERGAFVEVHNTLADTIAKTLERVSGKYKAIGAWVSPGLTHRSFLADSGLRKAEGLAASKQGPDGRMALRGALDQVPGAVEVMPSLSQLEAAKGALVGRLKAEGRDATTKAMQAVYARGDGNDTPLGLPEALVHLTGWLDEQINQR